MFLGEYSHNLDSKGRLTIPAKYREQLEPGMVVTRNPSGGCLLLMPMDEWERVSARGSALPRTDRRAARLRPPGRGRRPRERRRGSRPRCASSPGPQKPRARRSAGRVSA